MLLERRCNWKMSIMAEHVISLRQFILLGNGRLKSEWHEAISPSIASLWHFHRSSCLCRACLPSFALHIAYRAILAIVVSTTHWSSKMLLYMRKPIFFAANTFLLSHKSASCRYFHLKIDLPYSERSARRFGKFAPDLPLRINSFLINISLHTICQMVL